jgi:hypothetical protein
LFPGIQVVSIDESLSSIFLNSILFLCSWDSAEMFL